VCRGWPLLAEEDVRERAPAPGPNARGGAACPGGCLACAHDPCAPRTGRPQHVWPGGMSGPVGQVGPRSPSAAGGFPAAGREPGERLSPPLPIRDISKTGRRPSPPVEKKENRRRRNLGPGGHRGRSRQTGKRDAGSCRVVRVSKTGPTLQEPASEPLVTAPVRLGSPFLHPRCSGREDSFSPRGTEPGTRGGRGGR
jgi:hypothetical protein